MAYFMGQEYLYVLVKDWGQIQSTVSSRTRLGATGRTWVFKMWSKDVAVEETRRVRMDTLSSWFGLTKLTLTLIMT